MIRFVAIALFIALLMGPCGEVVGGAIETGYEARESNTRLAVAQSSAGGAEIVSAAEYADSREER